MHGALGLGGELSRCLARPGIGTARFQKEMYHGNKQVTCFALQLKTEGLSAGISRPGRSVQRRFLPSATRGRKRLLRHSHRLAGGQRMDRGLSRTVLFSGAAEREEISNQVHDDDARVSSQPCCVTSQACTSPT